MKEKLKIGYIAQFLSTFAIWLDGIFVGKILT